MAIQAAIANCSTSLDSETIQSVQQTVQQLEKRAASAPVAIVAPPHPQAPLPTTCATDDELAAAKSERDAAQADDSKSKTALDAAWREVQKLNNLVATTQNSLESQRTKYHLPLLKPDTPLKRILS